MKRTLSLILALILCIALCACNSDSKKGDETTSNPDEIKLTLENYSKYLDITGRMNDPSFTEGTYVGSLNGGYGIAYEGGSTFYLYKYFNCSTHVEGVSQNYNYNDVKITVRYKGEYQTVDTHTNEWTGGNEVSKEVTIECNIAGEGSFQDKFEGNGGYMLRDMADIEWEVVEISGTLTPAK